MIPHTLLEYIWCVTIKSTVKDSVFHNHSSNEFCQKHENVKLHQQ